MRVQTDGFSVLVLAFGWVSGMVLAPGAWLTVLAFFFPPYAWYLSVARLLAIWGVL